MPAIMTMNTPPEFNRDIPLPKFKKLNKKV